MPDVGTSLPSRDPQPSHVTTSEWQSFEVRMRYRRAERCVIRAEEALAAGFEDEARHAHDEARELAPEIVPTFADLQERIAARALAAPLPSALEEPSKSRAPLAIIAVAAAGILAALGVWTLVSAPTTPTQATVTAGAISPSVVPSRPPTPPSGPTLTIEQQTVQADRIRTIADRATGSAPLSVPLPASMTGPPPTVGLESLPAVAAAAPSTVAEPPLPASDRVDVP